MYTKLDRTNVGQGWPLKGHIVTNLGTAFYIYFRGWQTKKYLNYSLNNLQEAVEADKNGLPLATASRRFSVPRTTLRNRVSGKYDMKTKMGPKTVLILDEENSLVNWLITISKAGFPTTRNQLLDRVALLIKRLKRDNNFNNGRPGRHWFEGFLRRHKQLSQRMTQNLTQSRGAITEEKVRGWFIEIGIYFQENKLLEIVNVPERVFNCDETAFFLSPNGKKVLAEKGTKALQLNY